MLGMHTSRYTVCWFDAAAAQLLLLLLLQQQLPATAAHMLHVPRLLVQPRYIQQA
jgi:hypothetical protein